MDERDMLDYIGRAYEAAGDPSAWHGLTLDLARGFAAEHCHLVVFDGQGRVQCDFVTQADAGAEYASHYASLDTAVHRVLRGPDRIATSEREVMSSAELKRCPVHQELLPRFGVAHRLWTKTALGREAVFIQGIIRGARRDGFSREEYRRLEALHTHIERSLRLHLVLARANALATSLEAGLDALETGLLLLESDGRILFANRAASGFFPAPGGLGLERARLVARNAAANARLQHLLARALGRDGPAVGGGITLGGPGVPTLVLRAFPVVPRGVLISPRAAAVVLIQDIASPAPPDPELLAMLGLTRAEARWVAALAGGETVEGYARRAGLTAHTVRSMLKMVFAKTGTHRQSELVALVLQATRRP